MRRFDGAVNWPGMDTYTRKLFHLVMKLNLQSTRLALGWTRTSSTRCRSPSKVSNHSKSDTTWPKCDKGIGKRDSKIILKRAGVFLQVGSGKMTLSTLFYSSLLKFDFVYSKLNGIVIY